MRRIAYLEDEHKPELDPTMAGHNAENEEYGDAYAAALNADYLDAVTEFPADLPQAAAMANRAKVAAKKIAEDKKRLVETQIRTGQGRRNAKRAQRRYFAKPENALRREIREHAQKILAEEARRFEGDES